MLLTRTQIRRLVYAHGREILEHDHMAIERVCYQHGVVTTFAHSIRVACLSVWLADRLHLWNRVDLHSLIRAALLHDYFLYDWHDWDNGTHRLHGFTHGETAMRNAIRDFKLNQIERDSIEHHMFPLTPYPPKYIEGYLVTAADKISATKETLSFDRFDKPASGQPMAVALTLEYLFLWFLLYAFIGWVYESVLVSVSERRWVNRGFLNGPLCPIYGCGAVLAIVLLHDFTNPIEIFLISSFGASILEYITSWGMEKLFHARWWDYSHYRFNIQGRICLLGAIVFGFGGVLIIDVVQPQVERLTAMIPLLAVHVICAVAAIVVIIDTIVTVVGIVGLSERLAKFSEAVQDRAEKAGDSWQWGKEEFREKMHDLSESSQERVANMRQLVSSALNWQQRRMIRSFPRMRSTDSTKYSKIMETVREMLRRK